MSLSRLLLPALLASATALPAQVGVNNDTPEQTLDVGGKVKIGDDANAPTAGTLRYNTTEGRFEGHDGSSWSNLSAAPTGSLPTNPEPFNGRLFVAADRSMGVTNFVPVQTPFFEGVPAGKHVIVTAINLAPSGTFVDADTDYVVRITPSPSRGVNLLSNGRLTLSGNLGESRLIQSGGAPLLILKSGEFLNGNQLNLPANTEQNIVIELRGFLVDDLNY